MDDFRKPAIARRPVPPYTASITHAGSHTMSDQERIIELTATLADVVSRKVEEIKKVTGTTRILALNALIEAARAGEAGKGFAVVAGEVKNVSESIDGITQSLEAEMGAAVDELGKLASRLRADSAQ
jgi:methyl-accepting chemotaxis protein